MKKALITGSQGFVGPYLKKELEQSGYVVYGIDNKKINETDYFYADITNQKELEKILREVQPEYIYHLAGVSSPAFAEKNPDLTYSVNVKGTENIFNIIKNNKEIKVLVVNSSFVYGNPVELPMKEDHPLNGKGVYAESRIEQEKIVSDYKDKIKYVIVRSFNHTGPGQMDTFVIPKIIKQIVEIKKGQRSVLEIGNTEVRRDISDVRDVVRAYRLLLEQNKFGVICNVCRGESIGLKDVIEYVQGLAGFKKIKIIADSKIVSDEAADIYGDNSYLQKLTGWKPEISYQEMLKNFYQYWDSKII